MEFFVILGGYEKGFYGNRNENGSCTLPVGSTQGRNSNADPSLSKSDWILTRFSLILLLGVKTQEGSTNFIEDCFRL